MPKRFTDSLKWADPWFQDLPVAMKAFWIYLLDNCDHAGFWKVNLRLAQFQIGTELNESDIDQHFAERVRKINDELWFVPKFITFQYGELSPDCRPHKPVLALLSKYGIKTLNKGLSNGTNSAKEQEQEKEKEKDKEQAQVNKSVNGKVNFSYDSGKFDGITERHLARWTEAYPAVDISGEIKRAAEWLLANPHKHKQRYGRFLVNWFGRTQERGGTKGYGNGTKQPQAERFDIDSQWDEGDLLDPGK